MQAVLRENGADRGSVGNLLFRRVNVFQFKNRCVTVEKGVVVEEVGRGRRQLRGVKGVG